jgi:3-hydroxyisobutyrate dehydrogenase
VTSKGAAVGFVGAGAMGSQMIARLSEAGFEVLVYDIDPLRRKELARLPGVMDADSLNAFSAAPLLICMLPSSAEVDAVVAGAEGLLSVLPTGALIVDMCSSDPHRTIALAARARGRGIDLADAPVSGGVAKARTGELTIMFGGGEALLARCRKVLEPIGATIVPVGGLAAGTR